MAMREATPEEIALITGGDSAPKGMREATPEEIAMIDPRAVKPGDVEARRKQVQADAAAEGGPGHALEYLGGENARPGEAVSGILDIATGRVNKDTLGKIGRGVANDAATIAREFGSGVMNFASGMKGIFSAPPELTLKGILNDPRIQAAFGAAQAVASPMAPASNLVTKLAEEGNTAMIDAGVNPQVADTVAGLGYGIGQALLPGSVYKGAKTAKPSIKEAFESNRSKATKLEEELAARAQEGAAEIERLKQAKANIKPEADAAIAQRQAQYADEARRAAEAKRGVQSNISSAEESVASIAEAEKASIPDATELRERFAPNAPLGEEAGASFQKGFNEKFNESKRKFKTIYDPIRDEASNLDTNASNYLEAGGELSRPEGITKFGQTKPEGLAERIKRRLSGVDAADFEDDTYSALQKQLDEAGPADKARVQGVLDEFVKTGKVPEKPTVADLILERRRLKAGMRAVQDDNSRRQFKNLINALEEDIAQASEPLAEKLFQADALYATEHAPFFSRGSVTRAIAEGKPNTVVDSIYRPTVSGTGRALKNNSVEAMERARALITDPKQWDDINKAFVNKGVQSSYVDGTFKPERFVKWFESYLDPSGTGNKVLRTGLGEEGFRDLQSTVRQLQTSKTKTIDQFAEEMTKSFQARGQQEISSITERTREAREAMRQDVSNIRTGAAKEQVLAGNRVNVATTAQRLMVQKMEGQIKELMGKDWNVQGRLEGIGAGVFTSGLLGGEPIRAMKGGWIALSAHAVGKLLETTKGRSLFKAMARATPGTGQASAVGRQMENFFKGAKKLSEDEENG